MGYQMIVIDPNKYYQAGLFIKRLFEQRGTIKSIIDLSMDVAVTTHTPYVAVLAWAIHYFGSTPELERAYIDIVKFYKYTYIEPIKILDIK